MYEITPHHSWARPGSEAVSIDRLKPFRAMYVDALEHHCPPDPKADLKMLGDEFAEFIDTNLEEEIDAGPQAPQQWLAGAQQAPPPAAAGPAAVAADPPPFGQLEHAAHPVPHAVFNNEDDAHVHPRCGLVRDKPAVGEDKEEWTPKRQTGNTGIYDSLFLLHHWYVMLLPRKISTDKDVKSTNAVEQSKRGS
jgi:hypothetical protein